MPTDGSSLAARRFMADKHPASAIEQVACLAYFLTYHRQTPVFKGKELSKLNAESGAPRIGNMADALGNAARNHYLSQSGGGKKSLGILGEQIVTALPDRAKVQAAIQEYTPKRRKGRAKKKASKK
jgi:hypothetical protein